MWFLQPVVTIAAEGFSGARGVEFLLLPRMGFIVAPTSGDMNMFRMERGFHIFQLTLVEKILVQLASFASNTQTVNSIPSGSN